MVNPRLTRLLRRGLILLGVFFAVAVSSSLPLRTQASNPNYFCSVTIVSEVRQTSAKGLNRRG